jgi:hypothetical protein
MPVSSQEGLQIVEEGDARIQRLIGQLSDQEIARPGSLGDGGWGVRDLIGHLASWEERALEVFRCARTGEPFQALIGIRSVDVLNARTVDAWRERSLQDVRADAAAIHGRLSEHLGGCAPEEWRTIVTMSTGRRHRVATLVGSTLGGRDGPFTHARDHVPDLAAYLTAIGRAQPETAPPS